MKPKIPYQLKIVLAIIVFIGLLCAVMLPSAKAQNTFSNAPTVFQPALNVFSLLPTTNTAAAKLYVDTGAWNGPSFTERARLDNFLQVDKRLGTNWFTGAEIRNVFSQVDYIGGRFGYTVDLTPTAQFCPGIDVGWSFADAAISAGIEPLAFRYQTAVNGPYLFVAGGWYELFALHAPPIGSLGLDRQVGGLGGKAGVTFAF